MVDIQWKDKLALYVNDKFIPIRDNSYAISSPKERLHTLDTHNAGWHHLPHEFTLTFSTYAVGDVGPFLHNIQDEDQENVQITISRKEGGNWTHESIGFGRGVITSIAASGLDARGIPIMTVECEFLEWNPNPGVT